MCYGKLFLAFFILIGSQTKKVYETDMHKLKLINNLVEESSSYIDFFLVF